MSNSYTKESRVRASSEYQRVFAARLRIHSRYFTLYHAPGVSAQSRIGVITSRKNLRYAVWRNRCKRIVRETFRQHKIKYAGKDIVLIGKHNIAQASQAELVYCLNKLFAKLKT